MDFLSLTPAGISPKMGERIRMNKLVYKLFTLFIDSHRLKYMYLLNPFLVCEIESRLILR